jgi:hypothetical protein
LRYPDVVVVDDRAGDRGGIDPDIAGSARAIQAVVDAEVVLDGAPRRTSFQVDARSEVVVDGVADDDLVRRVQVVDSVIGC